MASEPSFFTFNGRDFYLKHPESLGFLSPKQTKHLKDLRPVASNLIPTTKIDWDKENFCQCDIDNIYASFSRLDDVWCPAFLEFILLNATSLSDTPLATSNILRADPLSFSLPQGPYVIDQQKGEVFAVYRLYLDSNRAFRVGCLQISRCLSGFWSLPDHCQGFIAVPSRLYYKESVENPLAGLRFAAKDCIDMKGLRTSYGSKAYYNTHSEAELNAPLIQMLLDAGAVLVGQTKTSEFAEGVDPNEWIEYDCPLNPRGDGQQKPSSSSTGSAVAVAAYTWLDFSVGTDTGGSIRHPAGVNGIFGNRPTHGAMNLDGILGATHILNTVGIFARDPFKFSTIGSCLLPLAYQPHVPSHERKYKLLYPVQDLQSSSHIHWFPDPAHCLENLSPSEKCMEIFVRNLETYSGTSRQPFNVESLWRATRPKGMPPTLDEAVGFVYATLTTYFASRDLLPFLGDSSQIDQVLSPTSSPTVRARLRHGLTLSPSHVATALIAKHAFAQWFSTVLLGSLEEEAISILVFPQSFGIPDHRSEPATFGAGKDRELFDNRFSIYAFGYLVGCPDYTVPVGEVPFMSTGTETGTGGVDGALPVSVSLCARPGNDIVLFDVLRGMEEKGMLRGVSTGRRMYPD